MAQKQTYGLSVVWDPDTEGNTSKVIASSGQEVSALKLVTAEAGSGLVFLYDANTAGGAGPSTLRWVMDAAADNADAQEFPNPLVFKNGIYAVMEQGQNQRVVLCLAIIPAAV